MAEVIAVSDKPVGPIGTGLTLKNGYGDTLNYGTAKYVADGTVALGSTFPITANPIYIWSDTESYVVILPTADTNIFVEEGDLGLNIKDYGAVGDDSTDNFAVFTAAIADLPRTPGSLSPDGGIIFVPRGVYRTSATIEVDTPCVQFIGEGAGTVGSTSSINGASVIKPAAGVTGLDFGTNSASCSMRDIQLVSQSTVAGEDDGIIIHGAQFRAERISASMFGRHGINGDQLGGAGNSNSSKFSQVRSFNNQGDGFHIGVGNTSVCVFEACNANSNGGWGYWIDTHDNVFIASHADGNNVRGDYKDSGGSNIWLGTYSENNRVMDLVDTAYPFIIAGGFAPAQYLYKESNSPQIHHSGRWQTVQRGKETNLATVAVNEIQSVAVDATGGTFTLTFGGNTTSAIDFDATPAEVETALEALAGIGSGDVDVSGGPGDDGGTEPYRVRFIGALAGANQSEMTSSGASLTGGAGTATVSTPVQGAAAAGGITFRVKEAGESASRVELSGDGVLRFGSGSASLDARIKRRAANVLGMDTGDKLTGVAGLGAGNDAAATTPGSVTKKIEVFDEDGASLGFIPIYDAIT